MLGLTVLSPHRDDAAFSLALSLSRWSKLNVPIRVLNFFTISSYGPQCAASSAPDISWLREREDRRALYSIDPRIRIQALGLLDAPIRLNISVASISAPENQDLQPLDEIASLGRQVEPHFRAGLILAPLALGNHIDHRAVHCAALKAHKGQRLGFYEDLPYASWTSDEQLAARVRETERFTHVALRPVVIRTSEPASRKLRVVSRYRSQINRQEATAIAAFASRYGGGERLWIPRHGRPWGALIR